MPDHGVHSSEDAALTPLRAVIRALSVAGRHGMAPVVPFDLAAVRSVVLDFTAANTELRTHGLGDPDAFTAYVFGRMDRHQAVVGVGRYNEDRVVYRHSPLFDGEAEPRSVHLGIDLFVAAGTPVSAPLAAEVHSLADNRGRGNYGPTLVLEHVLDGVHFCTLYGHLSADSIADLSEGLTFAAGDEIARIGEPAENGGWPPHLHFQIITDMAGQRGDFPGVASRSQRQRLLAACPDPNLILGIPGL